MAELVANGRARAAVRAFLSRDVDSGSDSDGPAVPRAGGGDDGVDSDSSDASDDRETLRVASRPARYVERAKEPPAVCSGVDSG